MNFFSTALFVAAGTGLGAITRYLISLIFLEMKGIESFYPVLAINIMGSFLIGVGFCWMEIRFRRDGGSRLADTPLKKNFLNHLGLFEKDATLPLVDHFQSNQKLQFLSGFFLTGFLGGFTTFSSYCLHNVQLFHTNALLDLCINLITTPLLATLAVFLGAYIAKKNFVD